LITPLKEDLKVVGGEERALEAIAMNIVHQIGDALYDALPKDVAHKYFVDARQKTNDGAIDFVKGLIESRDQRIALEAQERELNKIPHRLLHIPEIWEHKQQRLATLKQSQKEE